MRSLSKVLLFLLFIPAMVNAATPQSGIEAFNKALDSATRSMNNAAVLALWEDDGVSLLPSTPPIVGKKAIGKLLDDVVAAYPGGKMKKFEMQCHDIQISGDWASEWCSEHQIVQYPGGKPPFDSWGKMLLVLHRGADGTWRVKEEMWNQGVAPASH
jgi:ketosteroid isomerase-like protein